MDGRKTVSSHVETGSTFFQADFWAVLRDFEFLDNQSCPPLTGSGFDSGASPR